MQVYSTTLCTLRCISDRINIFARQPPNVIPTKRSFPLTFSTVKESKGSGNGNKPIALSDSSCTIDYPSPPAALKLNVRGNIWRQNLFTEALLVLLFIGGGGERALNEENETRAFLVPSMPSGA